jgi:hypothetical protein
VPRHAVNSLNAIFEQKTANYFHECRDQGLTYLSHPQKSGAVSIAVAEFAANEEFHLSQCFRAKNDRSSDLYLSARKRFAPR